ncbi:hypothetical protein FGB62_58g19 [Gracilaria domingensis]|nr:hypothetical protein FGB62_58g19 [Gracilaria domingensis]
MLVSRAAATQQRKLLLPPLLYEQGGAIPGAPKVDVDSGDAQRLCNGLPLLKAAAVRGAVRVVFCDEAEEADVCTDREAVLALADVGDGGREGGGGGERGVLLGRKGEQVGGRRNGLVGAGDAGADAPAGGVERFGGHWKGGGCVCGAKEEGREGGREGKGGGEGKGGPGGGGRGREEGVGGWEGMGEGVGAFGGGEREGRRGRDYARRGGRDRGAARWGRRTAQAANGAQARDLTTRMECCTRNNRRAERMRKLRVATRARSDGAVVQWRSGASAVARADACH